MNEMKPDEFDESTVEHQAGSGSTGRSAFKARLFGLFGVLSGCCYTGLALRGSRFGSGAIILVCAPAVFYSMAGASSLAGDDADLDGLVLMLPILALGLGLLLRVIEGVFPQVHFDPLSRVVMFLTIAAVCFRRAYQWWMISATEDDAKKTVGEN